MINKNIILIIVIFLFSGYIKLYSQTDNLKLRLKNESKTKYFNLGAGIYSTPDNKKNVGLYLTGSYYSKITNNYDIGIGIDVYNSSTPHINSFTISLFLNLVFKFDVLKKKISCIAGGEIGLFLKKERADQRYMWFMVMFNVKSQYNINETFSTGLEYKTTIFYPFLLNTFISYNF